MGIPGLNEITKVDGVETFDDGEFEMCIFDGSNLVSDLLFGFRNKYREITDVGTIVQCLIDDIVEDIQRRINKCFQRYNCKKCILTFDTKESLNYNIQKYWIYEDEHIQRNKSIEYEIHQFKEEERRIRKINHEKTIQKKTFVDNDPNIMSLMGVIIHLITNIYKTDDDIDIIETTDEADFVIRNLAVFYGSSYDSILVISEDSDYFILLSDLANVYKTGVKNIKISPTRSIPPPIFNVSQLWMNYIGTTDYNIICFVGILAGCDYTSFVSKKKSIYEQNGERIVVEELECKKKTLLAVKGTRDHNIQLLFTNPYLLKTNKRLKFIQQHYLDDIDCEDGLNLNTLLDIISKIEPELIQTYINIINLYHSWRYINKFKYIEPDPIHHIEKIKKKFDIEELNFNQYLWDEDLIPTEFNDMC